MTRADGAAHWRSAPLPARLRPARGIARRRACQARRRTAPAGTPSAAPSRRDPSSASASPMSRSRRRSAVARCLAPDGRHPRLEAPGERSDGGCERRGWRRTAAGDASLFKAPSQRGDLFKGSGNDRVLRPVDGRDVTPGVSHGASSMSFSATASIAPAGSSAKAVRVQPPAQGHPRARRACHASRGPLAQAVTQGRGRLHAPSPPDFGKRVLHGEKSGLCTGRVAQLRSGGRCT